MTETMTETMTEIIPNESNILHAVESSETNLDSQVDARPEVKLDSQPEVKLETKSDTESNSESDNESGTNLTISQFTRWIQNENNGYDGIYKIFENTFTPDFRMGLYEEIYDYFNDINIVSNQVLTCWKLIVKDVMKNNRKYSNIY